MTPLPDKPKVIVLLSVTGEQQVVSNIAPNIEVVVTTDPKKFADEAVGMIPKTN